MSQNCREWGRRLRKRRFTRFWIDFYFFCCCFLREKEGLGGGSEDGECPKTVESGEGDSGKGSLCDFGLIFVVF